MKKFLSIIISVLIIFSCFSAPIFSATPQDNIMPLWSNIWTVEAVITFDETTGCYSASIEGHSHATRITATATLYYQINGGDWVKITDNWTYDVNQRFLDISEEFTAVRGLTYKVDLDFTVYGNGFGESETFTYTAYCPPATP